MGICASKCCPVPPSPSLSNASDHTQEKLVISQSLQPSTNKKISQNQPSLPTISSNTSSSYSSSSSSLNSGTTTSTSTINSSVSQSTTKIRPFSNEFLLSTAAKNSNIVILDPNKRSIEKPRLTKPPTSNYEQPRKVTVRAPPPPRQSVAVANQPFPSKRSRSTSPMSKAGRKIIRTEPAPVEATQVISQLSTPSAQWRQSNLKSELKRRDVVLPRNVRRENLRPPATTTTTTAMSSYRSSSFKSSSIEKEAFLQQMHQFEPRIYEIRSREVMMPMQSCGCPPLAEDLNNPLMSMDCFIFL